VKKSESAEVVMMLLAAYPHAKATPGTSRVYETMLSDLDVTSARAAAQKLIAESKFMPTVAEIREEAMAIEQAKIAATAREREARRPSLTRAQLAARDAKRALKP
jgi:hypothetical protein